MAKMVITLEVDVDNASYDEMKKAVPSSDADIDDMESNYVMVFSGSDKMITGARILSYEAKK